MTLSDQTTLSEFNHWLDEQALLLHKCRGQKPAFDFFDNIDTTLAQVGLGSAYLVSGIIEEIRRRESWLQ